MKNQFMILDGSSLLYRAFFALPLLSTSSGVFTNALMGFANMLSKLIEDYEPAGLVVAFDKSRHTFRTEMYADYKGTRAKTPDELKSQIPLLKDMVQSLGINFVELDNYEADDIIGTLAMQANAQGINTLVVTGDKDSFQLIRPHVQILFTKRGIMDMDIMDEAHFADKYAGLTPPQLIDIKALMGDSSDNIPGVPGVGEKTALKLLVEYHSLEKLYDNIEAITAKKLKEKLLLNKELAFLSYKLATINCEAPLNYSDYDFTIKPNLGEFSSFCQKYELRTAFNRLKRVLKLESLEVNSNKKIKAQAGINSPSSAAVAGQLGLNFEEEPTISLQDAIIITSENITKIHQEAHKSQFISLYPQISGHVPDDVLDKLYLAIDNQVYELGDNIELLAPILRDKDITKICYDIKRFYHITKDMTGTIEDILLMAYLLDPGRRAYEITHLRQMSHIDEDMDYVNWDGEVAPIYDVATFNAIYRNLKNELESMEMYKLYRDIELPLSYTLAMMEEQGIYVNTARLQEINADITSRIIDIEQKIYDLAGETFNINSPKQLGVILFEKLNLPVLKKTKTGYSTSADILEELSYINPIVAEILSYRTLTKLKSTYLDAMEGLINPRTKRIHTIFNQTVTETGRLSSSEPNLQNIPVRTEEGKKIRSIFEPGPGYDALLSADYSQIELRIMADISQDKHFVTAFKEQQDIHTATAAQVFHVDVSEVTPEMRSKAKAVNFGIIYGISAFGLSRNLHISPQEAGQYIKDYLAECSGVEQFMKEIVAEAKENGYVKTLFGRRRYLPMIHSSNFTQRSLAERMALNTPIQGTAADIIKIAMNHAWEKMHEAQLQSRILLQVHDELVVEIVEAEREQVVAILKDSMENAIKLSVPLIIDIHEGKNWEEAK